MSFWTLVSLFIIASIPFLDRQIAALVVALLFCVYFCVEFGWGGGDPNHKDHNRPPWYL